MSNDGRFGGGVIIYYRGGTIIYFIIPYYKNIHYYINLIIGKRPALDIRFFRQSKSEFRFFGQTPKKAKQHFLGKKLAFSKIVM